MKHTYLQYAQALYESLQDTKPEQHDIIIQNFITVLKTNGDLVEYEKIIDEYGRYEKGQKGIKDVTVITASSTEMNKPLIDELNKIAGSDIEIKQKIDDKLIGGVVIKVDDTLIDGSVANQLNNLHNTLNSSANKKGKGY